MATTNIFNSNQVFQGAFHVGNTRISFGGQSADHLAQQVNYTYAQQIQMIYELGATQSTANNTVQNVYLAGGRASGNANISRIMSSRPVSSDVLLRTYNDICNPADIQITQLGGFCRRTSNSNQVVSTATGGTAATVTTSVRTTLKDAVMQSIAGSMDTQSAIFTQQMAFMFLNMEQSDASNTN